jgi:flagellar hook-length control protein FliK
MDLGQMNMLMQMPTGATLPVATPATSTTVAALSGDQKSGDSFAELLIGLSSSAPGQPVAMTGAAKTGNQKAPDTIGEASTPVQPDVKPDDMLAMFLAAVGSGNQVPSQDANADKGTSKEPAESKQLDTSMPQNVALYAAGAQMALPTQINGRMPETNGIGQVAGDAIMTSPAVGTVTGTGVVSLLKNTNGQADVSFAQNLNENGVSGEVVANGVSGKTSSQQFMNPAPLEKGVALASELQLPHQAVSQQAADVMPEATAPLQPVNKRQEPNLQQVAAKSEAKTPVIQTQVIQTSTDTANATSTAASATPETTPKPESPAFQGVTVLMSQASAVPTNTGMEKLAEANVVIVPAISEISANQPGVVETGKETAKLNDVAVPHSSSLEAAFAGNQPRVDHVSEKPVVMTESSLKAGVVQQISTTKEGLADGSDSGTSGEKFEGFTPKLAEAPVTVPQQMTGGHQVLFTEALGSATPQPVQANTPAPVSHEQVASQVREQLVNHDLKPGSDQITFKLSPDHLGDIKVNLTLQNQRLSVEIVAENRAARDSLLQHVNSLKESLARQNITVEKFDVTTGGGNTGSQGNNAQGEWRELAKNRQSQQWFSAGGYRTPLVETVPSLPIYQAQTGQGMVDLHF